MFDYVLTPHKNRADHGEILVKKKGIMPWLFALRQWNARHQHRRRKMTDC